MVRIYNTEQIYNEIAGFGRRAFPAVRRALAVTAASFVTELRSRYLSGPTSATTVSPRTGALRRGIRFAGVQETAAGYVAKVTTDRRYAFVHMGRRGTHTLIKPRNARALAIPLAAARTAAGVSRGGPRSGVWGNTFFAKARGQGNTVGYVFGGKRKQSGAKAGSVGKIVPLFALVKSVKVPARIDPKDFLRFLETTYRNSLTRELNTMKAGK